VVVKSKGGESNMKRRFVFTVLIVLTGAIGATLTLAASTLKPGTWTGLVTDTIDGATEAEPARVTENVKEHGAMYAFIESKTKRVYVLNPQNQAAPFAGRAVVVKGTMDTATITIMASSITAAPEKPAK
jgi:hypothetical protein